MAKLSKKLYIGPLAALQEKAIRNAIAGEKSYLNVYLVTLAANEREQLDIVSQGSYFSRSNPKRMEIVGIAYGKDEALSLVRTIADEVYRESRAGSIRQYFTENG